ncbi:Fumarylacetoacetate hydrolase domain-containing-like protein [Cyphellophora attinorum]|uniref:Fumarylacetoacetate hydrolase domain-containing-like protein n=1 Tax=Cyphellophora attinorum TaxID=1664694 RepID=A0A0N0NP68_9EURO|nr:Fumarylacetoacetate hydrolase domain-containing-like protein [Phialophora attinorum]KPI42411.1 Fumarylacetoacetate hydrolase domain-containing-like protein [Phialophora attinorum]
MADFRKLIRFKDASGQVYYGEAGDLKDITQDGLLGADVPIFEGQNPWTPGFVLTESRRTISEVLAPIEHVPIFYCVGLNYKDHVKEAGAIAPGEYPLIFTKPTGAAAGPFEDIPVHPEAHDLDYEVCSYMQHSAFSTNSRSNRDILQPQVEFSIVIGKKCKNVSATDDPFQYVLGYTAGNDLSSRFWQQPHRGNGQPGIAKSFDKFAPIGPVITSTKVITDSKALSVKTFVNGEQRQDGGTDDWYFDVPCIIRHLSRGVTLQPGTVIMTGTPSGVAAYRKPPLWLQDQDVLETQIENIGTMRNRIIFEK